MYEKVFNFLSENTQQVNIKRFCGYVRNALFLWSVVDVFDNESLCQLIVNVVARLQLLGYRLEQCLESNYDGN